MIRILMVAGLLALTLTACAPPERDIVQAACVEDSGMTGVCDCVADAFMEQAPENVRAPVIASLRDGETLANSFANLTPADTIAMMPFLATAAACQPASEN